VVRESVDVYLELCAERGESPEKPDSGQFVLRIDPQLHRAVAHAAEERGLSLNRVIEERLEESFGRTGSDTGEPPSRNHRRPKGSRRSTVAKQGKR
jgi:hypothetical protein